MEWLLRTAFNKQNVDLKSFASKADLERVLAPFIDSKPKPDDEK
jgi:hypothetical protein